MSLAFPEGTTALATDSEMRSLQKICELVATGGGGGGGTTEVATGTSDPVGAPASGIVFFARTDVVRLLQWNGSDWVVITSEI